MSDLNVDVADALLSVLLKPNTSRGDGCTQRPSALDLIAAFDLSNQKGVDEINRIVECIDESVVPSPFQMLVRVYKGAVQSLQKISELEKCAKEEARDQLNCQDLDALRRKIIENANIPLFNNSGGVAGQLKLNKLVDLVMSEDVDAPAALERELSRVPALQAVFRSCIKEIKDCRSDIERLRQRIVDLVKEHALAERQRLVSALARISRKFVSEIEQQVTLESGQAVFPQEILPLLEEPNAGRMRLILKNIIVRRLRETLGRNQSRLFIRLASRPPGSLSEADVLDAAIGLLDPASVEYRLLISVRDGRDRYGRANAELQAARTQLIADVKDIVSSRIHSLVQSQIVQLQTIAASKEQIDRALAAAGTISFAAVGREAVERLGSEQAQIVGRLDAQTKEITATVQTIRADLADYVRLVRGECPANERPACSEKIAKLRERLDYARDTLSTSVTDFEVLGHRLFASNASVGDRIEGLRIFSRSTAASLLPPNISKSLVELTDTAQRAANIWTTTTATFNEPSADNIGGVISALSTLPMGQNERRALNQAAMAMNTYSTVMKLFAVGSPIGFASVGMGMLGSGGSPFGGGGGPDPAIMQELAEIKNMLRAMDAKLDRIIDLQKRTLEQIGELRIEMQRNHAEVMAILYEVRGLQEQTLERLNFYGAQWTRQCAAISAALETQSIRDVADARAWQILRGEVDNVVACVSGMQTFLQNARDGKTYAARAVYPVLQSAIDNCRASADGLGQVCDRARDWSVFSYERTVAMLRELDLFPRQAAAQASAQNRDTGNRQADFHRFIWGLSNPAIDVRALDRRVATYGGHPGANVPVPFSAEQCGQAPSQSQGARPSAVASDNVQPASLMGTAVATEWIADHARLAIDFHPLLNIRPFLRSNELELDINAREPHHASTWALLCHTRIALQIAIAQQALTHGDGLLPQLYEVLVADTWHLLSLEAGAKAAAAQGPADPAMAAARRAKLFELFRSNRLMVRNLLIYTVMKELDRYGDRVMPQSGNREPTPFCVVTSPIYGHHCFGGIARNTRSYQAALEHPRRYIGDSGHRCGRGVSGPLEADNDNCLMSILLPRLRGFASADLERPESGAADHYARPPRRQVRVPVVRYIESPFIVREMAGETATCRIEPGRAFYFVWQHKSGDLQAPKVEWNQQSRPEGWYIGERAACPQLPADVIGKADPASSERMQIIDGDQVFLSPMPTYSDVLRGQFHFQDTLVNLLRLESEVAERLTTIAELTSSRNSSRRIRQLFLLSTLAAVSSRH